MKNNILDNKKLSIMELRHADLETISGGYIFETMYKAEVNGYEVIDDKTGDVVKRFRDYERWEARKYAREHGYSDKLISWDELRLLRVKGPKTALTPEEILRKYGDEIIPLIH